MDKHIEKLCIWSGPLAALLFFTGLFPLANMVPPPFAPGAPINEVVAFYNDNRLGILFGEMVVLWASCAMIPFFWVVFAHMRRIERGFPLLSGVFLLSAIIIVVEVILPAWAFAATAMRPRPDEITLAFSDLSMLMFVWPNPQTFAMMAALGYAILRDPNPRPLFPRWMGFVNIGLGLLFVGSTFCTVVWSGPLAWNGLLSFWLPAIDFGNWFVIMFFALRNASKRDDYESFAV